jgi:betaine-aldehyde dehydrogenase
MVPMDDASVPQLPPLTLPAERRLYYGGAWRDPVGGGMRESRNPGSGEVLCEVAEASNADVDAAVAAAAQGFALWRDVAPLQRGRILRELAARLRSRGPELALLDAADSGNPVAEMLGDVEGAAAQIDFFAGLVTEMKGASIPMGPGAVNFSVREPLGVVARILPFNHPLLFCAGKTAAILAAGNAVVVKPPEQAPLSALRLTELAEGLFPPGVWNLLPGGREAAAHLAAHPGIAKVALIGSVPAGRAVMRAAAETLKPVLLELGGKNALIAFADADPDEVAAAAVAGMNFAWCGQSCGSTSRVFLHEAIHDAVLAKIAPRLTRFRPGPPTDPATTMGALVSPEQHARVLAYIESARAEGARLVAGGGPPVDPALAGGLFIEPTVFADVTPAMRIAREEIFGPVLSVLRWREEARMLAEVDAVEHGLTCSIWTDDLSTAHRVAGKVRAGFVWVNEVARHFLGAPFGGYKSSGLGREECLEELIGFTQEKNIHIRIR